MQLLLRWILSAVALYITVVLGQALGLDFGIAHGLRGAEGALIAVVIFAVVNAVIRPVLAFLTAPLSCLTFGLVGVLLNGLMFWIVGQVTPGFHVGGFLAPIFGAVVMGLVSGALNNLLVSNRERERARR